MKLSTLFMIMIALQLSLIMFNSGNFQGTSFFEFIANPTDWSNNTFVLIFGAVIAAIVLTGAFVGTFIFGKTDLMVFATAVGSFITFCIPIAQLWQLIYGEGALFGETTQCIIGGVNFSPWATNCAGGFVATLVTAPLAILAIFTIINWWRSNSEM